MRHSRYSRRRNDNRRVNSAAGTPVETLFYSYDALNRPISRNADIFGYNELGEVIFSRRGAENAEESYAYDDIGNLLTSAFSIGITNAYTSNNRNQYSAIQEISTLYAPLRETSYDLDGNMTRYGEWTYTYDSGNRLISVSSNNTLVATFAYDTQGRRVKKVSADGTHRYFYDGWLLVYEHITRSDNTISEVEYIWGKDISGTRNGAAGIGGLLYLKRDGEIYVPWYDAYGNILGYRDAQGNTVASYTYDAFGNIVSQSGTMSDAFVFRFFSKYFDAETGLYYYGYRYYKPQIMRWLTEDPLDVDGGMNLYTFCENGQGKYDALGQYVNMVYEVEKKTLTATDVDTSESITLKEKVFSGNGKSCCVKADQWIKNQGPLPVGKYLVGRSYVPKHHRGEDGDYNWYRLYGNNGSGGYEYEKFPVKAPNGTTVYRGRFNLHTGRASDGCVTVWSDVRRGDKGYPRSNDYDKLKRLLDKTKPLRYKNSDYSGWLEVK